MRFALGASDDIKVANSVSGPPEGPGSSAADSLASGEETRIEQRVAPASAPRQPRAALAASLCVAALLSSASASHATSAAWAEASRLARGSIAPQTRDDAPLRAARWLAQAQREGERMPPERLTALQPIVADLRILVASQPGQRTAAALALLDIASLAPRRARGRWASPLEDASALAFEALERGLDIDSEERFAITLAEQAAARDTKTPLARRRAALEALRGRRIEATLAGVLSALEDPAREVRDAAADALAGWDHPQVHQALIGQWLRIRADLRWSGTRAVERHFAALRLPRDSPLERALFDAVRLDLVGRDWRAVLRALRASAALDNALAVPMLIESLGLWLGRRQAWEASGARAQRAGRDGVSIRVEHEFVAALERRSGKRIGPYPERWSRWWRSARDEPATEDGDAPRNTTRAGFYGLRPATDRVCFVLDRSGSMEWGRPNESSRYARALAEMERFLRDLGPGARFRVVLFSSKLEVWKDELVPANPASIGEALQWAGYHKPDGGTELRRAIEHVLRLDRAGEPVLARLEEDTVIVLCDGATAEGPSWIEPLFERVGSAACVAFHCVMIGRGQGDGALRALAEQSGGAYVESDG